MHHTHNTQNRRMKKNRASTDRGRSVESTHSREQLHALLSNLETMNPLSEPARDPRMEGSWVVQYTDAPPPSNGQLGIFRGVAKQVINLKDKRYRNELYVGGGRGSGSGSGSSSTGANTDDGGDVQGAWLTAVLDATWDEWDGVYLDSPADVEQQSSSIDNNVRGYPGKDRGAMTWKVDFVSITLSIFQIPLFTQQFKKGTSRTWEMTYLDDDTRIVRAGKTGRGQDDWIFYMKRG